MAKQYWNLFKTGDQRPWPKVGVAFMNKDGSYNLRLRGTLSAADKLQMREGKQKDQSQQKAKEQGVEHAENDGTAREPQGERQHRKQRKAGNLE